MSPRDAFKRGRAEDWTLERLSRMSVQDVKQLRENAIRLNEEALVALCGEALKGKVVTRAHRVTKADARAAQARNLIARRKAFELRGVHLVDPRTSWGGQRKSDGAVVFALWADAVESVDGGCRYLLWSPNLQGQRPWSDKPAGRERLEHCKRAIEVGRAEGLLVYGQRADGQLPEDKAHAVHGADAEIVLSFEVKLDGDKYWAVWGGKAAPATIGV